MTFKEESCMFRPWDIQGQPIKRNKLSAIDVDPDVNISKKLQELSMEEREQALYDLHGVSDFVEEMPKLITEKLEELDIEVERTTTESSALTIAAKQSIDFVKKTRLMFLRAEVFNAEKAAKRMALFFDLKKRCFGEAKLTKEITWSDLSESDQQWLKNGPILFLPQRDRAGRAVLFRFGNFSVQEDMETQLRLILFTIMCVMHDEEIQKRGMVWVQYSVGLASFSMQKAASTIKCLPALPIRRAASHLCYDNPLLHPAAKLVEVIMTKNDAKDVCRFRAHFGSHMECQYALNSFGIVRDFIPVNCKGEWKDGIRQHWLKQIAVESINGDDTWDASSVIIVPGPVDVILGRGRHAEQSTGNWRFKLLLEEYKERYDAAKKFKRNIMQAVLNELKTSGSRFIKREGSVWKEIPDSAAMAKIAHAFRNLRTTVGSSNVSKGSKYKRGREEAGSMNMVVC